MFSLWLRTARSKQNVFRICGELSVSDRKHFRISDPRPDGSPLAVIILNRLDSCNPENGSIEKNRPDTEKKPRNVTIGAKNYDECPGVGCRAVRHSFMGDAQKHCVAPIRKQISTIFPGCFLDPALGDSFWNGFLEFKN